MERDKIEKKCIFTKDSYTDEERKVLCEDCKEKCEYSKKEEPVSEDLDFIATRNALAYVNNINRGESPWLDSDMELAYEDGMKAGANWQKEQFEKNRLAHCDAQTEEEAEIEDDFVMGIIEKEHRQPTFDDAIKYGMRLQKEQMIKDAVECYIRRNRYTKKNVLNGFDVTCDAIQKFNNADKVKVIVIKED